MERERWGGGGVVGGCVVLSKRLAGVRDEGWSVDALEKCADGIAQEGEGRARLLRASGQHGPDAFRPALAGFAPRALGDVPVQDHETNRLLRQVVGGFDAGRGDEADVTVAVLFEAAGDGLGLGGVGHAPDGLAAQEVAGVFQLQGEARGRQLRSAMDERDSARRASSSRRP